MSSAGSLIARLHSPTPHHIELPVGAGDIIIAFLAGPLTVILHEALHGAVLRTTGYRISYGVVWQGFFAYTTARNQFVQRRHALVCALTPLLLINGIALPLLAVEQRTVIIIAFMALLTNTTGAVSDVLLARRLLALPRQALVYDIDSLHIVLFVPTCLMPSPSHI